MRERCELQLTDSIDVGIARRDPSFLPDKYFRIEHSLNLRVNCLLLDQREISEWTLEGAPSIYNGEIDWK